MTKNQKKLFTFRFFAYINLPDGLNLMKKLTTRLSFCRGQWLAVILAPAAWWSAVFILSVGDGIPDWLWVPALGAWYPMAGAVLITIIVRRRPNAILTVAACFLLAAGAHLAGFISHTVLRIAANGCLPGAYTRFS